MVLNQLFMHSAPSFKPFPAHGYAVAEVLDRVYDGGVKADKAVEQILRADKRRGGKDRAYIAHQSYELIRWRRWLNFLLGMEADEYTHVFHQLGAYHIWRGLPLPDWREWADLPHESIRKRLAQADVPRAIRESIPNWLDALGENEWGGSWPMLLQGLNAPAPVVLRANALKAAPEQIRQMLAAEGVNAQRIEPHALLLERRQPVFHTRTFQDGFVEVQDYASQQVAPFCQVRPGMTVIDACAGAGGKSLHLATLMENRGRILAMDIHTGKLAECKSRARRNGIHIIEIRESGSGKSLKRLAGKADRLLLDVPCSGTGVLRRNPDAKWRLSPGFIDQVRVTQQDLLQSTCQVLRPGGKLIYATCSILPGENQRQIAQFLSSEKGSTFRLEEERILLPHEFGYDGFFMARLEKSRP